MKSKAWVAVAASMLSTLTGCEQSTTSTPSIQSQQQQQKQLQETQESVDSKNDAMIQQMRKQQAK